MISIIRLKSQEMKGKIGDSILSQIEELQAGLSAKGQLLYLTKREKHEDVSLFIHTTAPNVLGDFIVDHLGKIEHITGIWVINLIKPIFYPLPKDTRDMKRFSITLEVFPKKLKDVYEHIARASFPVDLRMAYLAYTFHMFGDIIQFSILAEREEMLYKFLAENINNIPGVLNTNTNMISSTKPLVSYEEWKIYSAKHGIVPFWDEELMISQFRG